MKEEKSNTPEFNFIVEQFADIRILRYKVSGFQELSLNQKKLIYFLSEAARCGRDITFDQNGRYNLAIRKTLENIYETYSGDRESPEFAKFTEYLKRVWFSNGIYHHYSTDKIIPDFSPEYFKLLVKNSDQEKFPLKKGDTPEDMTNKLIPIIFDSSVMPKKVCQDTEKDMITNSAVNFYQDVTQKEAEDYYNGLKDPADNQPVSYGINSKLIKKDGKLIEQTWKYDGLYSKAIEKIIYWLGEARQVAENEEQRETINKLIEYYKTGDLNTWDKYNIHWVKDLQSQVDFVNGFIESYDDPLGLKATWESVVNFKDLEATHRTEIISTNAQWFEDHSPIDNRFKKTKVKGITAKVITVAQLGGECYPSTPIGINLPNADWIRKEYGSKSVTMENITYAYDQANQGTGFIEEFSLDQKEIELVKKHGFLAGNLHTDLHECLGHGSGQLLEGTASDALKNYQSPLEETRADLFALYYIMDPKMVELGLMPDLDVAKAEYINYIRNGLMTQLTRIQPGKNIEQAHMRNRQLISKWCMEKGRNENVIERISVDGKTFFRINDFDKLRSLFGELLKEVQRIKSEGDYEAGKKLVENYGVKVDQKLHDEVLERYKKLNMSPFSGFLNPDYQLIEKDGEIIDIEISYPNDYPAQMMLYSKEYSYLPAYY